MYNGRALGVVTGAGGEVVMLVVRKGQGRCEAVPNRRVGLEGRAQVRCGTSVESQGRDSDKTASAAIAVVSNTPSECSWSAAGWRGRAAETEGAEGKRGVGYSKVGSSHLPPVG